VSAPFDSVEAYNLLWSLSNAFRGTYSDRVSSSAETPAADIVDAPDAVNLASEQVGRLGEAEVSGLGEHVVRVHGDRRGVPAEDLECDHFVAHPASP